MKNNASQAAVHLYVVPDVWQCESKGKIFRTWKAKNSSYPRCIHMPQPISKSIHTTRAQIGTWWKLLQRAKPRETHPVAHQGVVALTTWEWTNSRENYNSAEPPRSLSARASYVSDIITSDHYVVTRSHVTCKVWIAFCWKLQPAGCSLCISVGCRRQIHGDAHWGIQQIAWLTNSWDKYGQRMDKGV